MRGAQLSRGGVGVAVLLGADKMGAGPGPGVAWDAAKRERQRETKRERAIPLKAANRGRAPTEMQSVCCGVPLRADVRLGRSDSALADRV
jgi:hypothetical protein